MYWHQKGTLPFIGGRSNTKDFFNDLGQRCGVSIRSISTSSVKKARQRLEEYVSAEQPLMLYGDMAYIPWFSHFPDDYHFGGHTFVICGYDGQDTLLASDIEPRETGMKKGFFAPITFEQLEQARNSPYKPFPPRNTWLEFDFSGFHEPRPEDIYASLRQTARDMLEPPISNMGVKGIRRTAKEILKWPGRYDDKTIRLMLFNIYIFGRLFKDFEDPYDVKERIESAFPMLNEIADLEYQAYRLLSDVLTNH
jgi:hypothetical protein